MLRFRPHPLPHPDFRCAVAYADLPSVPFHTPEWARDAALYQLHVRQMTPEGTLQAASTHLPRLRALGITVVWLLPVHPIGEAHRKGTLGSPYAVRDYTAVSDDLGSLDDLRAFVDEAHRLGMKVLLDWVANHTAPDHPWTRDHPDWYARDPHGRLRPTPWWDWSDIVELDYQNADLRRAMIDAMGFWVREADVDGFRCDVAGFVPNAFWKAARAHLDQIKPVFLLAEWEGRDLHEAAFDASYAWQWYDAMTAVADGRAEPVAMRIYYSHYGSAWPREAMRLTFLTNHDKNAWEGTEFERFGPLVEAALVLSVVGAGLPTMFTGQEIGLDRRLAFFERDPVDWSRPEHPHADLYRRLFALRRQTSALHSGAWGAPMLPVATDADEAVIAFVRQDAAGNVLAVFNLTGTPRTVHLRDALVDGVYTDFQTGTSATLREGDALELPAWGWRVLVATG